MCLAERENPSHYNRALRACKFWAESNEMISKANQCTFLGEKIIVYTHWFCLHWHKLHWSSAQLRLEVRISSYWINNFSFKYWLLLNYNTWSPNFSLISFQSLTIKLFYDILQSGISSRVQLANWRIHSAEHPKVSARPVYCLSPRDRVYNTFLCLFPPVPSVLPPSSLIFSRLPYVRVY